MAKVYVFNKSTSEVVKVVEAPTADACLEQLKLEGGIDEAVFGVAQNPPSETFVPVPAVEGETPADDSIPNTAGTSQNDDFTVPAGSDEKLNSTDDEEEEESE